MRLLIAIKSCQRDKYAGCHQAIRETWGANLPQGVDLLFFMGGDIKDIVGMKEDERHLSVDDGYWPSTPKMLAIMRYAVREDYDFALLCDTDTYLHVPGLMKVGFENYDYSGALSGGRAWKNSPGWAFGEAHTGCYSDHGNFLVNPRYSYMSGGHGYIVSNRAAKVIITLKTKIQEGEDMLAGWVLGPFFKDGELTARDLPGFKDVIAFHLNCGFYGGGHEQRLDPASAVRRKHKEFTEVK